MRHRNAPEKIETHPLRCFGWCIPDHSSAEPSGGPHSQAGHVSQKPRRFLRHLALGRKLGLHSLGQALSSVVRRCWRECMGRSIPSTKFSQRMPNATTGTFDWGENVDHLDYLNTVQRQHQTGFTTAMNSRIYDVAYPTAPG